MSVIGIYTNCSFDSSLSNVWENEAAGDRKNLQLLRNNNILAYTNNLTYKYLFNFDNGSITNGSRTP